VTKSEFRNLVKRLHPDTSGDKRTLTAYRNVVNAYKKKKYGKCWCGVTINADAKRCRLHRFVDGPVDLISEHET